MRIFLLATAFLIIPIEIEDELYKGSGSRSADTFSEEEREDHLERSCFRTRLQPPSLFSYE